MEVHEALFFANVLCNFKEKYVMQALFTIVELVKENRWVDLRGLISRPFFERLQQDTETLERASFTSCAFTIFMENFYINSLYIKTLRSKTIRFL